MGKVFFIADPHFGDDRIRRYENRPYESTEQMDADMIGKWNEAVCDGDTVFVLGDFGAAGREAEVLRRLKGRKLLVKGNHDTGSNAYYRQAGFDEAYDHPILYESFGFCPMMRCM